MSERLYFYDHKEGFLCKKEHADDKVGAEMTTLDVEDELNALQANNADLLRRLREAVEEISNYYTDAEYKHGWKLEISEVIKILKNHIPELEDNDES